MRRIFLPRTRLLASECAADVARGTRPAFCARLRIGRVDLSHARSCAFLACHRIRSCHRSGNRLWRIASLCWAYAAGRLLDDYVGLRGSVPTANVTAASGFGRLWSSVFLAAFFLLDGWAIVITRFAQSLAKGSAWTADRGERVAGLCVRITGNDCAGGLVARWYVARCVPNCEHACVHR